jgi:hypothetical protein
MAQKNKDRRHRVKKTPRPLKYLKPIKNVNVNWLVSGRVFPSSPGKDVLE